MIVLLTHEYPPVRGGVATYCFEVEKAAAKLGIELEVWAPQKKSNLPRTSLDCGRTLSPIDLWHLALEIEKRKGWLRGNHLIAASYGAHEALLFLSYFKILKDVRIYSLVHGSEVPRFSKNMWKKHLARQFFRQIGGICTVSNYTRTLLEKSNLLNPGTHVQLAHCAPSSDALSLTGKPFDRVPGKFHLLSLSRLHPRKGHEATIAGLARLPHNLKQKLIYKVGGSGDSRYIRTIHSLCQEASIELEFLGDVSPNRLGQAYASCDSYIQTSRTLPRSVEGFGITYLEAAAHGKPSIGFQSGGAREAVLNGQTGFLLPEGDLDGIAHAVKELMENTPLREKMGQTAKAHTANFSWEDTVQTLAQMTKKTN